MIFTFEELIKATAGRLLSGKPSISVKGVSIDSRALKKGDLFIAIKGEHFDGHDFIQEVLKKKAAAVIIDRKSKVKLYDKKEVPFILVDDTIKALGDIARFHRQRFDIPVIGITGSNGKTTTKDMAASLLGIKFSVLSNAGTQNNQIGLPLTLLRLNKKYDAVIIEMGTNHCGEIKYLSGIAQANIGVITNIGSAHLEYFGDLKTVNREKYNLIENLKFPYVGILNADNNFLKRNLNKKNTQFLIGFGIRNQSDYSTANLRLKSTGINFTLNNYNFRLSTLGAFNVYNALAAIAITRLFGIDYSKIRSKLGKFTFPEGRLEIKRVKRAIFIDDSYNSNPLSLEEALNTLSRFPVKARKIIVMGDMLELGTLQEKYHFQAGKQISKICDIIISVGPLARLAALAAKKEARRTRGVFTCDSLSEAKEILFRIVKPTAADVVLVKGSRRMKLEGIFPADNFK